MPMLSGWLIQSGICVGLPLLVYDSVPNILSMPQLLYDGM